MRVVKQTPATCLTPSQLTQEIDEQDSISDADGPCPGTRTSSYSGPQFDSRLVGVGCLFQRRGRAQNIMVTSELHRLSWINWSVTAMSPISLHDLASKLRECRYFCVLYSLGHEAMTV